MYQDQAPYHRCFFLSSLSQKKAALSSIFLRRKIIKSPALTGPWKYTILTLWFRGPQPGSVTKISSPVLENGALASNQSSVFQFKKSKLFMKKTKRKTPVLPSNAHIRNWLREILVVGTGGCGVQEAADGSGWPCGTCTIDLLTRIGLNAKKPEYRDRNKKDQSDRHNEVWRAILQIRDAKI